LKRAEDRASVSVETEGGASAEAGADGRGAEAGEQSGEAAGAQAQSAAEPPQTPTEQAASLSASPEAAVEDQVMPAYDTGLLRDADLIDAGLREDDDAGEDADSKGFGEGKASG
ncbi:hypothetical protein, partial [Brevibacterium paucivorans]|uniref:hypothetical protein n=1 Tax=Brevibacterium paucivorans TaxID=170994 RepID=UPI003570DF91